MHFFLVDIVIKQLLTNKNQSLSARFTTSFSRKRSRDCSEGQKTSVTNIASRRSITTNYEMNPIPSKRESYCK